VISQAYDFPNERKHTARNVKQDKRRTVGNKERKYVERK
jgi:hypothetical protein